jgi:hypothetical protein
MELSAPQVLEAIPAHLDAHGWCQGKDHNAEGAACLRGAINDLTAEGSVRDHRVADCQMDPQMHFGAWNDAKGRTVEEVKAACLTAAALELGGAYLGDVVAV